MSSQKFRSVIDEAVVRILSRASDPRGLTVQDITPRVEGALDKYLFKTTSSAEARDVKAFIDDIRADDLCLVLACEKNDETAWADLVRLFDPTVRSAARKMCGNAADADDLASSIWAELYGLKTDDDGKVKTKLSYYSGRGSLGGWLRAIVSQLAVDEFRKQSRFVQVEEEREFESMANEAADDIRGLVSAAPNPEQELSENRAMEDVMVSIREAISRLEAEDRLILKLYYFDDLKLKDIAATFGFHEATASRRIVKIQSNIRELVTKILQNDKGWSRDEVDRQLAETATKLGIGMENLFALIIFMVMLQEALGGAVQ